ncbi:MAG: hypothetical protein QXU09_01235 [Thermoproteota archaeon]
MSLVLTIDVGNTNMKGLVISDDGKVVDRQSYEVTLLFPGGFSPDSLRIDKSH